VLPEETAHDDGDAQGDDRKQTNANCRGERGRRLMPSSRLLTFVSSRRPTPVATTLRISARMRTFAVLALRGDDPLLLGGDHDDLRPCAMCPRAVRLLGLDRHQLVLIRFVFGLFVAWVVGT
jgi:hypothetical protein